jgi:hypothetical protein
MGVARTPAPAGEEVSEREYQATINRAVEDTEREIFEDALGEDALDNDGDTSLEEMGEGLEGEVEDDAGEEADEAEPEDGEGEDAETDEAEPERDDRGRGQPAIPPGRLREQTRRATAAEERAQTLERQVFEMNGRLAELSARTNAPPPKPTEPPPPKPDMYSDQEGYERWVLDQAEKRTEAKFEQRFTQFQQEQQAREARRVDESLAMAAKGERAFEFGAAYDALTSLDPRNPQSRATVGRIYNAPDPAKALFDWWEDNGGPEYRERILEQLDPGRRTARRGQERDPSRSFDDRGGRQQPRHVIRPGQRLPSLNSATGSNSQRVSDPEMLDGSEEAIFRYGTRR